MNLLVLGIGNTLLSDEGVGIVAMRALQDRLQPCEDIDFLDGGTLSFTLAPAIADCSGLIVFDAAMIDGPAGSVGCFEGDAMDKFIGENRKASVHEVGLLDLMSIARLSDHWPDRRALIGIRPVQLDWGELLSPAVAAGVPQMCQHAEALLRRWRGSA